MVVYDLVCGGEHRFEGWFRSGDDCQRQSESGLINCPVCGSANVRKLPTAARVQRSRSTRPETVKMVAGDATGDLLRRFHDFVDKNFDDVGGNFADEARRIHYGVEEARNIRGRVSADEAAELREEGVSAVAIPPRPVKPEKLN